MRYNKKKMVGKSYEKKIFIKRNATCNNVNNIVIWQ